MARLGEAEDVIAQHHQKNHGPCLPNNSQLFTVHEQQIAQCSCSVSHSRPAVDDMDDLEALISAYHQTPITHTSTIHSIATSPSQLPPLAHHQTPQLILLSLAASLSCHPGCHLWPCTKLPPLTALISHHPSCHLWLPTKLPPLMPLALKMSLPHHLSHHLPLHLAQFLIMQICHSSTLTHWPSMILLSVLNNFLIATLHQSTLFHFVLN